MRVFYHSLLNQGSTMNQPERGFYNLIKPHLPGDHSRVENYADSGTPDVSGACFEDYWIETKICGNTSGTLRDVRKLLKPSQIVWHKRRSIQGSRIFVLVRYPITIAMYRVLRGEYVFEEYYAREKNRWPWPRFTQDIKNHVREWDL